MLATPEQFCAQDFTVIPVSIGDQIDDHRRFSDHDALLWMEHFFEITVAVEGKRAVRGIDRDLDDFLVADDDRSDGQHVRAYRRDDKDA